MQWRVYYLYSTKIKKFYLGKTNELSRRLMEHNNHEEKYTKRGVPWTLVGFIDCATNSDASTLEHKLKKSKNPRYVTWFIKTHGTLLEHLAGW